jgi:hypothetical protein
LVDGSVAIHIAGDSGPRHSTLPLAAGWQRTWRIPDAHVEGRLENALGFLAPNVVDQLLASVDYQAVNGLEENYNGKLTSQLARAFSSLFPF